jgi:uncharacterized protein (TIGR02611 family)
MMVGGVSAEGVSLLVRQTLAYKVVRRIAVAVIGGTIVLLGVAMLVLPGPGLLTIVGGLAVLGVEFAFARRWLNRARESTRWAVRTARDRVRRRDGDRAAAGHHKINNNS